jgi:ubiquinone/menaquinone biosynthesis C-methylase UbiE
MPKTFFDKFLNLTKGKVLDVGSGPGRDGLFFKQNGLDVVCLDASEEMIKLCLEKGLNAVVGDFKKIQFEDNSFDSVWAYTSLLHSKKEEIDKSLKEIKRVLKKDGIFGLGMMEGDNEGYRQDYKGDSSLNQLRWFSYFSKEELETLLQNNGFEIIYFESFKPSSRTYLNFLARNTK